jgi:hypothetical protein
LQTTSKTVNISTIEITHKLEICKSQQI